MSREDHGHTEAIAYIVKNGGNLYLGANGVWCVKQAPTSSSDGGSICPALEFGYDAEPPVVDPAKIYGAPSPDYWDRVARDLKHLPGDLTQSIIRDPVDQVAGAGADVVNQAGDAAANSTKKVTNALIMPLLVGGAVLVAVLLAFGKSKGA
jgi:hypothetical protein